MKSLCPQCLSEQCGEYRCRFTMIEQARFLEQRRQRERYAATMTERDVKQPTWLTSLKTGERDDGTPGANWK